MCKAHSYDDFMRCPRSAAPVAPEGPRIPPVESAMATPEVPRTVHRTRRLLLLGAAAGASFGEGPIAGFRSIIVASVRNDDSIAAVQDEDGAPRDRSAFKLGSLVEIEGGRVELRLGALATAVVARIVLGRSLLGPVGPVDTDAATGPSRTVLGQKVLVTAGMVFDDSIPGGPAGIAVGGVLEVQALYDPARQRFTATRIERKLQATAAHLRDRIRELDTAARTFKGTVATGKRVVSATRIAFE